MANQLTKKSTIPEIRDFILNSNEVQTKTQIVGTGKSRRPGGAWLNKNLFFQIDDFFVEARWQERNSVFTTNQPKTNPKIKLYKKTDIICDSSNFYSYLKTI